MNTTTVSVYVFDDLSFQERPSITLNPARATQVKAGEELRIECTAHGDPTPLVSWERLDGYM